MSFFFDSFNALKMYNFHCNNPIFILQQSYKKNTEFNIDKKKFELTEPLKSLLHSQCLNYFFIYICIMYIPLPGDPF